MQYFGIGFLVLLFLEIMSVVWVAGALGAGTTLLLMAVSFVCGILMLRNTGLAGVLAAGAAVRSGSGVSLYQLLWPLRYALAALLLMSPGFVSTVCALVLLLPFKGRPIAQTGADPLFRPQQPYGRNGGSDDIIEGDYTVTPKPGRQQDYIDHKPD